MRDTKIYDLIRSYIAKENFTKQELSDLGVAIANLGGTQDNPELLKRFSSMRVRILEDKKIKKLNKINSGDFVVAKETFVLHKMWIDYNF